MELRVLLGIYTPERDRADHSRYCEDFSVLSRANCDVKNGIPDVEGRGLCTSTSSRARLPPCVSDVSQSVFPSRYANAPEPDP